MHPGHYWQPVSVLWIGLSQSCGEVCAYHALGRFTSCVVIFIVYFSFAIEELNNADINILPIITRFLLESAGIFEYACNFFLILILGYVLLVNRH